MKEIVNKNCYFSKLIFILLIGLLLLNVGEIHAQHFEYIDLSKNVNQAFIDQEANDGKDGWADFGKDDSFHNLPLGIHTFKDGIIPFNIINPEKNNGKSAIVLSGPKREDNFPKRSGRIRVNGKFESLFFLQTSMYVIKDSKELIKYQIHYKDNSEAEFICNNRVELEDWWEPNPFLAKGKPTYVEAHRWLINTPWKNPHPNKTIDWIEMHSTGNAIPILVAITGAKNPKPYDELKNHIDSKIRKYELSNLKIALLQIRSNPDPKWNLEKGTELCREAAKNNADIALFPELYNIGYSAIDFEQPNALDIWKKMAIKNDDRFITHFRDLAEELNMAIVITYLEDIGNDQLPRNTAALIDRHGKIVFTYSKIHTTDFSHLENSTTPGDDFYVKELDTKSGSVKIGMMICYDREFPESARILMIKGAEVILTPNACILDDLRLSQFRVRAMENVVATVMTNYSSEGHDRMYNGNSCIFDANASKVTIADRTEGIFFGTINMYDLRKQREKSIWGDAFRRPHKYKKLLNPNVIDVFKRNDSYGKEFNRLER